jgi:hypothetical protein
MKTRAAVPRQAGTPREITGRTAWARLPMAGGHERAGVCMTSR